MDAKTKPRQFRTQESLQAERRSRNLVKPFLESRGFVAVDDNRRPVGEAESQTVSATSPSGTRISARVRLCWRYQRGKPETISAAQLRARLTDDDWDLTLSEIRDRAMESGVTHFLLLQPRGDGFDFAALLPVADVPRIWRAQCETSESLIATGKLGRIRKNHAKNGGSPTLYLKDTRTPDAHAVPDVLWSWPGVSDLCSLQEVGGESPFGPIDDTLDDLQAPSPAAAGSDSPERRTAERSYVKRDDRVRRQVLDRADGVCENPTCSIRAPFPSFLDVHHIFGVETSDRAWNCVAICPNCHRAAHYAPDRSAINEELLRVASRADHEAT
ncbi:5-methylcytosine-specific restriction enzyme A [Cupriavidus metallidurans]|nr:HNH endonuclease [Cupriavidus pauculus]